MEPVEDGQGHGHVGDDWPGPLAAVKFDLGKIISFLKVRVIKK